MNSFRCSNRRVPARLPLATAIALAVCPMAQAQTQPPSDPADKPAQQQPRKDDKDATLGEITVTAQKRSENMQKVPISIQVLGNEKLEQLHVNKFEDYAKLLPSVSYDSAQPGFAKPYMRAVVSGGDGNHSGPLPSVGVYLDEEPITTIQGPLDIHLYDVARVEALAGPQGTLYGASSQAGTLRIITNKPDPSMFQAGYGAEVNSVSHGGIGHVLEGFVNIPMGKNAAIRLVGWNKKDAGFIDNVRQVRTYPSSGAVSDNKALVRDNYNSSTATGARAALRINLGEHWTITPTLMGQRQKTNGEFRFDPVLGDLNVGHFRPEHSDDRWWQAALTVQGKVGNFDLTYAYAKLKRDVDYAQDYNDYSFWYDTLAAYGNYWYDNDGHLVNPSQYIQAKDAYGKQSHELRIASPQENRVRFVAGVFMQTQDHDIQQRYRIDNIADSISVRGWPGTIWLTKQKRRDHDEAVFGEVSWDILQNLTLTGGMRHFKAKNSLQGFFGYAYGYASQSKQLPENRYGEAGCVVRYGADPTKWPGFNGAPCSDFHKTVNEDGNLYRVNLTYRFTPDIMVYGTWSEGYRPGGINRRGTLPPYLSDYLTNYEAGWKTSWMKNRLRFNGAVFSQRWKDFQFTLLGANGLTEIRNANNAQVDGLEMDLAWAATYNFTLTTAVGFYNPRLTANYCGDLTASGKPNTVCATPQAPKGAALPVTPKFKGNLVGRYAFDLGKYNAYVQGVVAHVGERRADLRTLQNNIRRNMPAYTTLDLSAGLGGDRWNAEIFMTNVTDARGISGRSIQCIETVCGAQGVVPQYPNGQVYSIPIRPRMIGLRFSQNF